MRGGKEVRLDMIEKRGTSRTLDGLVRLLRVIGCFPLFLLTAESFDQTYGQWWEKQFGYKMTESNGKDDTPK